MVTGHDNVPGTTAVDESANCADQSREQIQDESSQQSQDQSKVQSHYMEQGMQYARGNYGDGGALGYGLGGMQQAGGGVSQVGGGNFNGGGLAQQQQLQQGYGGGAYGYAQFTGMKMVSVSRGGEYWATICSTRLVFRSG